MSEFKNKVITPKGMELLTKALAGESLEFTSIQLGDGKFEGDIGLAESMVSIKQELPINKISRKGSQVTLSATLRLEDINVDFHWSEVGIYARGQDGIEILYMYSYTDKTSYISKDALNEKLIQVTVMVSNVAEVTALVDDSLIYLTADSLVEHNMDSNSHEDIREQVVLLKEDMNEMGVQITNLSSQTSGLNGAITSQTETLKECVTTAKNEVLTSISNIPTGSVKKVSFYKGKISRIDPDRAFSVVISSVDLAKSSLNLINCSAELAVPYLGESNVVIFSNMSANTIYTNIVYGFEVIEYY